MPSTRLEMHRNRFRPGLRPGPKLTALPQTPSWWGGGSRRPPQEPHPPRPFGLRPYMCRPPTPPKINPSYCLECICRGLLADNAQHGRTRRRSVPVLERARLHGRLCGEPLVHRLRHELEQPQPRLLLPAARAVVRLSTVAAHCRHPLRLQLQRPTYSHILAQSRSQECELGAGSFPLPHPSPPLSPF